MVARSYPFSIPMQKRMGIIAIAIALLLHMALGWLLVAGTRQATLPPLDISPIHVALLPAPSLASVLTKAPSTTSAHAPSAPSTPVQQTSPPPVTAQAPAPTALPAPTPAAPANTAARAAAPSAAASSNSVSANTSTQATLVGGSCAKPEYPLASRRMEEEGTVTLRFRVEATGQVSQSDVQQSSGFRRLDEAARLALSRCHFTPALVQGQATASWASIRYTWRLE